MSSLVEILDQDLALEEERAIGRFTNDLLMEATLAILAISPDARVFMFDLAKLCDAFVDDRRSIALALRAEKARCFR